MPHFHAVIWIDHREADLHGFNWDNDQETILHHKNAAHKIHHKAAEKTGSNHSHEDKAYLEEIAKALDAFQEILIVGPAAAKTELKKYLDQNHAALAARVVGVEAMDHPSDGELLAFARRYFRVKDRATPQR